jgi:hypothetical protein
MKLITCINLSMACIAIFPYSVVQVQRHRHFLQGVSGLQPVLPRHADPVHNGDGDHAWVHIIEQRRARWTPMQNSWGTMWHVNTALCCPLLHDSLSHRTNHE